jgi:hypothetical protein
VIAMADEKDQPRKKGTLIGVGAPSADEIAADAAEKAKAAADAAKTAERIAERAAREAADDEKHVPTKATAKAADEAEDAAEEAEIDASAAKAAAEVAKSAAKKAAKASFEGDEEHAKEEADKAVAAADRAKKAAKAASDAKEQAVAAQKKADHARMTHEGEGDEPEKRPALYLAQYETPEALAEAAKKVRDAGYEKWDCHTPYPVHGLDDAMGLKPTKLGFVSFIAGMTGLVSAVLMIQYMNNWDYPVIIGGKPNGIGGFPAMVPIMFELTILLTGFGTLFGLFHFTKLPRHHHPIFESDRFEASTDDKFFISIEVGDEKFDMKKTRALLESTHPSFVELVEEEVG